tara:strand:- start:509 stop:1306 length:798 start_codon:yes stop_codon:yes gene_type:complete
MKRETVNQIQSVIDKKYITKKNKLSIVSSTNYTELLQQHQKQIIEVDKSYIHKFVKIGFHLKSCEDNILKCYNRILNGEKVSVFISCKELWIKNKNYPQSGHPKVLKWRSFTNKVSKETGLNYKEADNAIYNREEVGHLSDPPYGIYVHNPKKIDYTSHLKTIQDHINIYEKLLIISINMINSLIDNDLIKFYEIYEVFDNIGVFDSKWERSLLDSIKDLNQNLSQVISSVNELNQNIKEGFERLSFDLNDIEFAIEFELSRINS